ncbi:MAG: ABC transporter permease [Actinomycetia bacterium]|nr:ABC transporter permease [Actinomycetes bacterium]
MINAIKSELRKYFTTRVWWGMAIGMLVAGALAAGFFAFTFLRLATLEGGSDMPFELTPTQLANTVYTSALPSGIYVLPLTIGVLQIGAEYRHKTITSTFLSTPKRLRALFAKAIALVIIAVLNGLVLLAGSVVAGATTIQLLGGDPFPSLEVLRSLSMLLLVMVVWALIGLGAGILIPNQVAALLIAIGLAWMVEPFLAIGLSFWQWGAQNLLQYFPTQATGAVVNNVDFMTMGNAARLDWWAAALVLLAYAFILAGLGIWRASREDVS